MRVVRRGSAIGLMMLVTLVAACDTGSPSDGGNVDPPTLALSAAASATVEQTTMATIPVTIIRGGSFSGPVTVTVSGLPAGVTAPSVTIATGATTGTVSLVAAADAVPGAATLTIHANGSGVSEQTATVALTTTVHGTYTLGVTPVTLSIAAGASGHADIAVTRAGGFAGTVALTAAAPAGLTPAVSAPSLSGTASASGVDVSVASTVAPGTYSVVITSATPGLSNQTATVQVNVPSPGSFTLAAPAMSVAVGATVNGIITVTRTAPFTAAVALTSTAPTGLTVTFNPTSVTGTTSGISVTAASTVTPGTYNVVVTGTGTGVAQQTATIAVTVTAVAPVPAITLAVAPTPVTLTAGTSTTATASIARSGGFAGDVALTVDAITQAGLTVSFAPASILAANTSSTMTVAATAAVPAGTYNVTVRANGTGITEKTVVVPVTVSAPAGSITLSTTPSTLSVAPGAQGTVTVNLTRNAPFTGAVAVTADALTGVTVTFAPTSLAAGVTTTTATVAVAGTVAPGNYTITLRATGSGVPDASTTVALTVLPPGGFSVSTPTAITMQAGATASAVLTVTRTGAFAGAVTLTSNTPTGMTVTLVPATVTGTSSTFNVISTTATPVGTSTITIHANATGQPEQLINVPVTITPASSGGGNVTFKFCGQTGLPLWVAAQSSTNGAWQRVTGTNDTYTFTVNGTGGIAYVVQDTLGGFTTKVTYGTFDDLSGQGSVSCSGTTGAGKTITGTVSGLAPTNATNPLLITQDGAVVNFGGATATPTATVPTFTLKNVLTGSRDLIAGQYRITSSPSGTALSPLKFLLQRNLNPADGGSLGTLNFATAMNPDSATLTIGNMNGQTVGVTPLLATSNTSGFYFFELGDTRTSRSWYGYPSSALQAGDMYELIGTAQTLTDNSTHRGVIMGLSSLRNATMTFGPDITAPVVSVTSRSPYVRIHADYTIQSSYDKYFDINYSQGSAASGRTFALHTSSGVTGSTTASVDVPDFTGVAGWDNNWGLRTGVSTGWSFTATGYTGSPFLSNGVLTDGGVLLTGSKSGNVINP